MQKKHKSKKIHWGIISSSLALLVLITGTLVLGVATYKSVSPHRDRVVCITPDEPGYLVEKTASDDESMAIVAPDGKKISVSDSSKGGLVLYDKDKIWVTDTKVNIFEHNDPRVKSDGTGSADHVIAPGTSNEYVFTLKNDKNQGVRYTIEISGGNDTENKIPVSVFVSDPDKPENSEYVDIDNLSVVNGGYLRGGGEVDYKINWQWLFNGNSDEYDTSLGDLAVNTEIPCHINVKVTAEYADEPSDISDSSQSGDPVKTGDGSWNISIVFAIAAVLSALIALALYKKKNNGEA